MGDPPFPPKPRTDQVMFSNLIFMLQSQCLRKTHTYTKKGRGTATGDKDNVSARFIKTETIILRCGYFRKLTLSVYMHKLHCALTIWFQNVYSIYTQKYVQKLRWCRMVAQQAECIVTIWTLCTKNIYTRTSSYRSPHIDSWNVLYMWKSFVHHHTVGVSGTEIDGICACSRLQLCAIHNKCYGDTIKAKSSRACIFLHPNLSEKSTRMIA